MEEPWPLNKARLIMPAVDTHQHPAHNYYTQPPVIISNYMRREGLKSFLIWHSYTSSSELYLYKTACTQNRISSFEVLDVLFWGRKGSPVAWTSFMKDKWMAIFDQKSFWKFSAVFFSWFFGHQNPGSRSGFTWNAGSVSGSGFNETGSTTLIYSLAQKCISKVQCMCLHSVHIEEAWPLNKAWLTMPAVDTSASCSQLLYPATRNYFQLYA